MGFYCADQAAVEHMGLQPQYLRYGMSNICHHIHFSIRPASFQMVINMLV